MSNVVKLDDRSVQGEVLRNMVRDVNDAHESGKMRALITIWLDTDGCWNYSHSTMPSASRAVGALEQVKHHLLANE